jgi:hypothetical protein
MKHFSNLSGVVVAFIDRQRGAFHLKVQVYNELASVRMDHDYYGTCRAQSRRKG